MHDDTTPDLFGHIPPPDSGGASLKAVAANVKRSPIQREFDRLVQRIEQAQVLLAAWQQQPFAIIETYRAKMEPALLDLAEAQTSMIVQLDALLISPPKGLRMTARRRMALAQCLLDLIDAVDDGASDEMLSAIRRRHGGAPEKDAASQRAREADEQAEIVAILEQVFGRGSIEPQPDESHEDFVARAQARLQEAMAEDARREQEKRQRRAEKRAKKKGDAKHGDKAQRARTETPPDASPPAADLLRTLYRKLASSIHPDREHDPAQKARKTESMQGLNTAYQNKDLLALLKLHNQTLQTGDTAQAAAEDTLREYNALLKTQLKTLEAQIARTIDEVVPPGIAMTRGRPKRPEQLERLMDDDIRRIARTAESMRTTVRDLNDPKLRAEAINEIVEMVESNNEFDEFDEFEQMMRDMVFGR